MDIGPHHIQMHQSRTLVNDINNHHLDDDDDDLTTSIMSNTSNGSNKNKNRNNRTTSNTNISFVADTTTSSSISSRRSLVGNNANTNNDISVLPSSYRQNEHNLAMMQDIVIEQILSGDLHANTSTNNTNNSYHSANTNPSSNRSVNGMTTDSHHSNSHGNTTSATSTSTTSAVNMIKQLSNNSIMGNSSNGTSRFPRFSSTKIPLVSKIMAPYRDSPTARMSDADYSSDHHRFPPRGGGTIIDLNNIDLVEEINLHDNHDQLPDVESYKASNYHRSTTSKKSHHHWYGSRNRIRNVLTIVSALCICVFFTLLGVLIGQQRNNSNVYNNNNNVLPSNNEVAAPSSSGSSSSNDIPPGYVEPADRYAALVQLVKDEQWSKTDLVDTTDSYQQMAIHWIAMKDTMKVPIHAESIQLKQRYVLAVLYYSLNGNNWNTNFFFLSGDKSECEWYQYWSINKNITARSKNPIPNDKVDHDDLDTADVTQVGVVCDSTTDSDKTTTGHITRLYMPSNNLHGEMPGEIGLLNELREINFYNNELNGIVHGTFSALTKLEAFVLYQNQIRDVIPTWIATSMSSTLEVFNWGKNDIYGMIPTNFNTLTKLGVFNCESCNIQGTLQPLQGMTSLEALHLGGNSLNGPLSEPIFDTWTSLMELDLSNNNLSGSVPRSILDNEHLLVVDLHSNLFTGEIYDINPGSNVRVLALHNNELSGRVDTIINNLSEKIQHLDLSNNKFVGSGIPPSIGRLTDLRYLYIAKNKFDRESIPTEIGLLTKLRDVSFQETSRIGNIPYQIKNCKELTLLDFNNNELTGEIPDEIGSLTNLRFILLRENSLSGTIPESFYQLTNLDTLLINSNRNIKGQTTAVCQPKLPQLRIFRSECSKFTGTSPINQCPCCTTCCDVDLTGICTTEDFFTNIDPTSEYQYVRKFYKFNEQNVIFPVPTASYDTDSIPLAGTDADMYDDAEPDGGPDDSAITRGYTRGTTPTFPKDNIQNGAADNDSNANTNTVDAADTFEEYYEDANGEDTPDNNVIDPLTYDEDQPLFKYEEPIDYDYGN